MKRFIVGAMFGMLLALAGTAFAGGMIGKSVDTVYPLFVNDTRCQVDAISIEGTSYIPVRSAAGLFGYDVNFTSDVIMLTKQKAIQPAVSTTTNENTPDTSIALPKTETITLSEYNQLQVGMSYEEAVRIIGGPGMVSDEGKTEKSYRILYTWYSTAGDNKGSAGIRFINGKLNDKLQQGLE